MIWDLKKVFIWVHHKHGADGGPDLVQFSAFASLGSIR